MTINRYLADTAPTLRLRLKDGNTKTDPPTEDLCVQFENKVLKLDDEVPEEKEKIDILDSLIATKVNISQLVRKIDMKTAEGVVRRHQAEMSQQNGIVKGGVTAAALSAARISVVSEDARHRLMSQGVPAADVDRLLNELAEDHGLDLAVKGDPSQSTPATEVLTNIHQTAALHIESAAAVKVDDETKRPNPPPPPRQEPGKQSVFTINRAGDNSGMKGLEHLPATEPGQVVKTDDIAASGFQPVK